MKCICLNISCPLNNQGSTCSRREPITTQFQQFSCTDADAVYTNMQPSSCMADSISIVVLCRIQCQIPLSCAAVTSSVTPVYQSGSSVRGHVQCVGLSSSLRGCTPLEMAVHHSCLRHFRLQALSHLIPFSCTMRHPWAKRLCSCMKQTGHQTLSVSFFEANYSFWQLLVCEQVYVNYCAHLWSFPFGKQS